VNYLDAGEVDRTGHDSDQSSYKQSEEDSTEEESDDGDEYAGKFEEKGRYMCMRKLRLVVFFSLTVHCTCSYWSCKEAKKEGQAEGTGGPSPSPAG
jgi:hypothetical protein